MYNANVLFIAEGPYFIKEEFLLAKKKHVNLNSSSNTY